LIDINAIDAFTILCFTAIIVFAALIHGTIGIGFPLISTPLLAIFTDVRTAILILVVPTVTLNIANIIKGGNWHRSLARYWPLAVYGIVGSFIGTQLLVMVSGDFFRPFLAVMILLYLNTDRLGVTFSWIHQYPCMALAITGITAGLAGGTVNVMLPVLIIYGLESQMKKTVMIQTFNFCFLLGKLTQSGVFVKNGMITDQILYISIPLSVLGLGVMLLGMRVRDRIHARMYRLWLRRLLAVMAMVLLIQYFFH